MIVSPDNKQVADIQFWNGETFQPVLEVFEYARIGNSDQYEKTVTYWKRDGYEPPDGENEES